MEFLIALVLFAALVACWCVLPGQSSTTTPADTVPSNTALEATSTGRTA